MTKEQEAAAIIDQLRSSEAGVADLIEHYEKVERFYTSCLLAPQEPQTIIASNTTNLEQLA